MNSAIDCLVRRGKAMWAEHFSCDIIYVLFGAAERKRYPKLEKLSGD